MRAASIDIGTNTILLLIAEVSHNGIIKTLHSEEVIARLGKGVDANRIILPETFERIKTYLLHYKTTCQTFGVEKIIAVGTSALRDAKNKKEFCQYIFSETGIHIEILSGDDEAQWTYFGGIYDYEQSAQQFSVIDIGGGSTEIVYGNKKSISSKISFNIGSVRITERFLKNSPPSASEIANARIYIRSTIQQSANQINEKTFVVGVSGTFTTLACINKNLPHYIPEETSGHVLTREKIFEMFNFFKTKSLEEIKTYPQITDGRKDIILAGVLILLEIIDLLNIEQITVSTKGLRYGIIHREKGI